VPQWVELEPSCAGHLKVDLNQQGGGGKALPHGQKGQQNQKHVNQQQKRHVLPRLDIFTQNLAKRDTRFPSIDRFSIHFS
jgi:hypothetical protein